LERVDDAEPVADDAEQLVETRHPVLEDDGVLRLRVGAVEEAEGARLSGGADQYRQGNDATRQRPCHSMHRVSPFVRRCRESFGRGYHDSTSTDKAPAWSLRGPFMDRRRRR